MADSDCRPDLKTKREDQHQAPSVRDRLLDIMELDRVPHKQTNKLTSALSTNTATSSSVKLFRQSDNYHHRHDSTEPKNSLIMPSSVDGFTYFLNKNNHNNNCSSHRRVGMTTTATSASTTPTTTTAYNENNKRIKNSDHPIVECRIPLVITNECRASRLKVLARRRKNPWQLIVAVYYLVLYITSSSICWAARSEAATNCTFPQRWEGTWFLSGYQQSVHIKGSQFSYRGKCTASDGNKYLIVDDSGCHRCLVIYEKHKNVLQFKESECEGDNMYGDQSNPAAMAMRSVVKSDHRGGAHPNLNGHPRLSSSDQYIMRSNDDSNDCNFCKRRETLQNLCDQIPGDALLYSLFRENAEAVKCPLKGPFSFTYNRGHGECKSPVSNIDSCTEESRLLLSFQACPDVQGTESTVEELTCLATWKDGNSRYLIGLVSHHHSMSNHHALSNEERYRCFVYEKISTLMGPVSNSNFKDAEYKLAQSGDATCNGLDSAEVGSRIMTLRKPPPAERCDFPAWFKGPRHWHALMGNAGYVFHQSDGSMHITRNGGYMDTRALCEQINKQTPTEMMAVVHYTSSCQSGFMCMMFYKRDIQVAEIQMGTPASRLEDACAPGYFDINKLPFVTLLASSPDSQICPLEGLYTLKGAIGPPYITSRHKRNHNNKGHNQHGHHHHEQGHKRHGTLSFRNSEELGQTSSWQSHTRGFPIRNRRAAIAASLFASDKPSSTSSFAVVASARYASFDGHDEVENTKIAITQSVAPLNESQRNRRDVPACVVNYKAQRQLLVGCSESNLIEVRPRCNEDGDESYICHGSWTENNTVYIIAKNQATQHGVCISYKQLDGSDAMLVVGDSCYRGLQKPPDHHFVANLTLAGKCGDTSSTNSIHSNNNWIKFNLLIQSSFGFTLSVLIFSNR